ncbi:hypothetical protein SNO17_000764 [Salmonella enterica]|uniref:hypothetical protein n=1 Tax=Salmonella enterica TaxID=28901 RepID=UPI002A0B707E|nr:hypothetical protein [Salmonella enterica]ELY6014860.1 hypothetical protein [Salmonella enterica]HCL5063799.1 hypothetical protein [Salmonella enterica]
MGRKNIAIAAERVIRIERVAVDITAKTGKVTKWTDVINYMLDNYLEDAKQDMLNNQKLFKKQSN